MKKLLTAVFFLAFFQNTYAEDVKISIVDQWARSTTEGKDVSAAYMNIENTGSEADVLYKVSSEIVGRTELHKVVTNDSGVSQMVEINKIVIPAKQTVRLAPKGLHIMLFDIRKPLKDGETITLSLFFEKSGKMEITLPVKSPANAAHHGKH